MDTQSKDLFIERFTFSVRLKSIFFPLSFDEMILGVEYLGYMINEDLMRAVGPGSRPSGSRVSLNGPIGEKAESSLRIRAHTDRGVLSVDGKDIEDVLNDFHQLKDWAFESIGVDLDQEAIFYESILEANLNVGNERNPIESIKQMFADDAHYAKFGEIMGYTATNFGVRIVGAGQAPSAETWSEFRVEPSVERSSSVYRVNAVVRGRVLEEQVVAAKALPGKARQIVAVIEESA